MVVLLTVASCLVGVPMDPLLIGALPGTANIPASGDFVVCSNSRSTSVADPGLQTLGAAAPLAAGLTPRSQHHGKAIGTICQGANFCVRHRGRGKRG